MIYELHTYNDLLIFLSNNVRVILHPSRLCIQIETRCSSALCSHCPLLYISSDNAVMFYFSSLLDHATKLRPIAPVHFAVI